PRRYGLAQREDADERGADGAHADEDAVGDADGQRLHRVTQAEHAERNRRDGGDARPEAREALGVLEAERPDHLEEAGEDEQGPVQLRRTLHDESTRRLVLTGYGAPRPGSEYVRPAREDSSAPRAGKAEGPAQRLFGVAGQPAAVEAAG